MRVDDVIYDMSDPVNEETAQALAINEALRKPLSNHLDAQQSRLRRAMMGGVCAVFLGIVMAMANVGGGIPEGFVFVGLVIAGGGYAYISSQSPDVTVTAVEKGYWTGHCLPMGNGTMVYDATATIDPARFELEQLADGTAVSEAMTQLDDIDEFPVVMPRDENVEETFTDTLTGVRDRIESAEQHTVEAPIVPADSPEATAIETLATQADDATVDADPVVSAAEAKEDVKQLDELEQMAAAEGAEAELEELSDRSRQLVSELSGLQETAVDLLNDHIGTAADAFGLVSYRFYCPVCQTDDIDSVVELSEPQAGEWYCETCQSIHDTAEVVPRHRIKDDLVNPIWDQLWIEKDDQRREIYENIEDQKADLREQEFEQRQEEIRTTTDRIRDLRARIRDLKTEAQAAEGKVKEIGDLMVKYERLHEKRKRSFEQEVKDAFKEINAETERILEETRNEEQERIEEAEQAAKEKAELMREEERRREAEKFLAAQDRADARAQAQLDQRAALHEEEMELMEQHHREEWMLKTRGRTSFSSLINRTRMRKDRLFGASAHDHGGDA